MKQALGQKEETRRTTLRLALAAIKNEEIARGGELDEDRLITVLSQQARQHGESMEQFREARRDDLVIQEEAELKVLLKYLPRQSSENEIEEQARLVIEEVGASSLAEMGDVMRVLMPKLRGKADGRAVSTMVKTLLSEGA